MGFTLGATCGSWENSFLQKKNSPKKALLLFRGKLWVPMKPTQTSTTWMSEVRKYMGYVMSTLLFLCFFGKNRGPFWTGAPPEIHPTSPLINPTALPKTVPKHPTWNSETARGLDPFAFRHRQCHRPTLRRPTPLPGREAWAADSEVSTPEDSLESLPGFGSLGELGVLVGYRPLRLGVRGFSWLDGASW